MPSRLIQSDANVDFNIFSGLNIQCLEGFIELDNNTDFRIGMGGVVLKTPDISFGANPLECFPYLGPIGFRKHFGSGLVFDIYGDWGWDPRWVFEPNFGAAMITLQIQKIFKKRDGTIYGLHLGWRQSSNMIDIHSWATEPVLWPLIGYSHRENPGFFISTSISYGNGWNDITSRNGKIEIFRKFRNKRNEKYKEKLIKENSLPPNMTVSNVKAEIHETIKNNILDPFEQIEISFDIDNVGQGSCHDCILKTIIDSSNRGLEYQEEIILDEVKSGKSIKEKIIISTNKKLQKGDLIIQIQVIDPKGFGSKPIEINLKTQDFLKPEFKIVDSIFPKKCDAGEIVTITALLQNIGKGVGEEVSVRLVTNEYAYILGKSEFEFLYIEPNNVSEFSFEIGLSNNYPLNSLPVTIIIDEKYGEYGIEFEEFIEVKTSQTNTIYIESTLDDSSSEIEEFSLYKTNTKDITFQSSDSTFYINSVAVIPKEIKACDGSVSSADELASYTETNILSHYNVTDRRHLEAILDEQRLQMSGLTFEETVLESGCIENAQAYLFVREGCLKGDEIIELRLVHCETSTLVWSCVGKNASIDEILGLIDEELSKD